MYTSRSALSCVALNFLLVWAIVLHQAHLQQPFHGAHAMHLVGTAKSSRLTTKSYSVAVVADSIYTAGYDSKKSFSKFSKHDLMHTATLTLNSFEYYFSTVEHDAARRWFYLVKGSSTPMVVRVSASSFTRDSAITLTGSSCYSTTMNSDFLFVPDYNDGKMNKVDLTGFTNSAFDWETSTYGIDKTATEIFTIKISNPALIKTFTLSSHSDTRSVNLTGDDGNGHGLCLDEPNGFGYAMIGRDRNNKPCQIIKFSIATLARVGNLSLGSAYYVARPALVHAGSLYLTTTVQTAGSVYVGRVHKVDLASFTLNETLWMRVGDKLQPYQLAADNESLFVPTEYDYLAVSHVGFAAASYPNMTVTSIRGVGNSGENDFLACVTTSEHFYAATDLASNSQVVKFSKTNLERIGSLLLPSAVQQVRSAAVDNTEEFLYLSAGTHPGKIARITLSMFTHESTATLTTSLAYSVAVVGEFVYATTHFGNNLYKIPTSTFNTSIPTNISNLKGAVTIAVDSASNLLYVLGYNDASVWKVNLADFTLDPKNLSTPANETNGRGLVIDADNNAGYFSLKNKQAIVKFDTSTMTRIGALIVRQELKSLSSGVLVGDFLYFGQEGANLIQIDVASFTLAHVAHLSGEHGENTARRLVVDGSTLYAPCYTKPGRIATFIIPSAPTTTTTTTATTATTSTTVISTSTTATTTIPTTPTTTTASSSSSHMSTTAVAETETAVAITSTASATTTTTTTTTTKVRTRTHTIVAAQPEPPPKKPSKPAAAASTSMLVASAVAGPAGYQFSRKIAAAASLANCPTENPLEELSELGPDDNLMMLSFGTPQELATYRGAVVGNFLFILILLAVLGLFVFLFAKVRNQKFSDVAEKLRFPGILFIAVVIFGPATSTSIGVLAATLSNAEDIIMMLVAVVLLVVAPVVFVVWASNRALAKETLGPSGEEDDTSSKEQAKSIWTQGDRIPETRQGHRGKVEGD